jgi:hypothetical protein
VGGALDGTGLPLIDSATAAKRFTEDLKDATRGSVVGTMDRHYAILYEDRLTQAVQNAARVPPAA